MRFKAGKASNAVLVLGHSKSMAGRLRLGDELAGCREAVEEPEEGDMGVTAFGNHARQGCATEDSLGTSELDLRGGADDLDFFAGEQNAVLDRAAMGPSRAQRVNAHRLEL